jgi:hypothetical protein
VEWLSVDGGWFYGAPISDIKIFTDTPQVGIRKSGQYMKVLLGIAILHGARLNEREGKTFKFTKAYTSWCEINRRTMLPYLEMFEKCGIIKLEVNPNMAPIITYLRELPVNGKKFHKK